MLRRLIPLSLVVLALPLLGIAECNRQPRIMTPTGGSITVTNVLSPVLIRTADLQGAGRIEALKPNGTWVLIHFAPGGSFSYDDVLPYDVWHCPVPNGSEGCVARLRVAHEAGPVGRNVAHGAGIVHVCTENYLQREGRVHCGSRELEHLSGGEDIGLPAARSRGAEEYAELDPGLMLWHGDPWNRLIVGSHEFNYTNASRPVEGDLALESSGTFFDHRFDPEENVTFAVGGGWTAYSMDLGACSFFIPWEWEHRNEDSYYTAGLGAALEDRGLAERFIDEMVDTTEPQFRTEVNAMLWIDGTAGIRPNVNASPEFHYRLSSDTGVPQVCFKQYFHANSDISSVPDHWYRFDQAIGHFFLSLLPWIGDCGWKDTSFRYCGTPSINSEGEGTFVVDQSSVVVTHQGYPWARVVCNNSFVPRFIGGTTETFAPGGEGATQIDAGIATLVSSLSDTIGLDVRRIEVSPRGMYLVTAENTSDPQYGQGDCRSDLDREPSLPSASRPTEEWIEYNTRGITRF
ncbi:MAG: hypothetical protein ACN4G0_14120 [Polyangiales bacterium]